MTMIRLAAGVLALGVLSGCAGIDTDPPLTSIPAGCEPTDERLTWSSSRTTTILTDAKLYKPGEFAAGEAGTSILNQPFTPSISGVTDPGSWLTKLGESLARQTEKPIYTTQPTVDGNSFGISAAGDQTQLVLYTGIEQVSADFEVQCEATVHGTLHAWSKASTAGVSCEYPVEVTLNALGRMGLALCPGLPTAVPSQATDSAEFTSDPRSGR